MRILHVIQQLEMGGAERVVLSLVRHAHAAGDRVAIASAGGALAPAAGIPMYGLPLIERRLRRVPAAVAAIRRALREEHPDIVHIHNPAVAVAAAIAILRGRRVPGLVSVHGFSERDDGAAARALKLAGLPVVACGPAIAEALNDQGVSVLATIQNGIPKPPPPADAALLRTKWGVREHQPAVLSVGRLVRQKNHSLAISAIARLPNVALGILGGGPLEDLLRAEAAEKQIADRVFLTGPRADAWELMGAADAVVLPSRGEGLPLTVLEALAIGTPLVATDVRGVRGLVEDGRTALLVPPDDPQALAEALGRVLTDENLARRLVSQGRQLAAGFDDKRMAQLYLDLYERLVARDT